MSQFDFNEKENLMATSKFYKSIVDNPYIGRLMGVKSINNQLLKITDIKEVEYVLKPFIEDEILYFYDAEIEIKHQAKTYPMVVGFFTYNTEDGESYTYNILWGDFSGEFFSSIREIGKESIKIYIRLNQAGSGTIKVFFLRESI